MDLIALGEIIEVALKRALTDYRLTSDVEIVSVSREQMYDFSKGPVVVLAVTDQVGRRYRIDIRRNDD